MKSLFFALSLIGTFSPSLMAQSAPAHVDDHAAPPFRCLEEVLTSLPSRWDTLPEPLIQVSSRTPPEIVKGVTQEQKEQEAMFFNQLVWQSTAAQRELFQARLNKKLPTETEAWIPALLIQETAKLDPRVSLLVAWLNWGEVLGRKDMVLFGASLGLDYMLIRKGLHPTFSISETLIKLKIPLSARFSLANMIMTHGDMLSNAGKPFEALRLYQRAFQLFEEGGDAQGQGNCKDRASSIFLFLGQKEKALSAAKQAAHFFEKTNDAIGQGNALLSQGEILHQLGKLTEALTRFEEARASYQKASVITSLANTFMSEALVYIQLGLLDEAQAASERSLAISTDIRFQFGIARAKKIQGQIQFRRGSPEEARRLYQAAQAIFKREKRWLDEANTLQKMAEVQIYLGTFPEAVTSLHMARRLAQTANNPMGVANALQAEGKLLLILDEAELAKERLKEAVTIYKKIGNVLGEAGAQVLRAKCFSRLNQINEALKACKHSRKLLDIEPGPLIVAESWFTEGNIRLFFKKEIAVAVQAFQNARKMSILGKDDLGVGKTYLGEATALLELQQPFEASSAAEQAESYFRKSQFIEKLRDALIIRARANVLMGQHKVAKKLAEEAIKLHDKWRQTRGNDRQRVFQDMFIGEAHDVLVQHDFSLNPDEALEKSEKARSKTLLDLLSVPVRSVKRPGQSVQKIQRELARIGKRLDHAGKYEQKNLASQRASLDRKLRWETFLTIVSEGRTLGAATPLDRKGIMAFARKAGPIISYHVLEHETLGFLIAPGRNAPLAFRIPAGRLALATQIDRLRRSLANQIMEQQATLVSQHLWQLLFAPISASLPAKGPLLIVCHGPLHQLPFEALTDLKGKPAFLMWDITIAASISSQAVCWQRHRTKRTGEMVAMFNNKGLGVSESEVEKLRQLLPSMRGVKATFSNYRQLVGKADQLMITTNGVHRADEGNSAYLVLEGNEQHDERLTAIEIAAMPIETELVMLASCDSAAGRVLFSEERLDLARAFLIAGSAAVLATRWKIPDEKKTTDFILDFYRFYRKGGRGRQGLRKDQALSAARRLSRERGDPAEVWAAWVLIGDPR